MAEEINTDRCQQGNDQRRQKPAMYKLHKRQCEYIKTDLLMENRVVRAELLSIEKTQEERPVALRYQPEDEGHYRCAADDKPFKNPLESAQNGYRQGVAGNLRHQPLCPHQISPQESAKDG